MDEAERCSHLAYIYFGRVIADGTPETLRRLPDVTPAGSRRFEISTANVTSALRKARAMPLVKGATIFGRSIHALVEDSVTQLELESRLRNGGIEVEEVRPLLPSLEDVFVELTYKHQNEAEMARA
jgi:ABC-type multidrug transport system ATPase subunit